jgi:hypothetical protein
VAAGEDQLQDVVADLVRLDHGSVFDRHEEADLGVLLVELARPPHQVDGAVLGGGHQPGARVVRDA